jgi:sulfatase modifying factor 1
MVSFPRVSLQALTAGAFALAVCLSSTAADPPAPPAGMVTVPGADYNRGRANDYTDADFAYFPNPLRDDQPVRTIHVDSVYMDQCEVTTERYAQFVKATGHRAPYYWKAGKMPEGKQKFPVVDVSWDDAAAFCQWDGGKRLPTEAEWEHACRGTAEGKIYPWGDTAPTPKQAIFSVQDAAPVCGDRQKNEFGLCDMIGNVWEWVGDWYEQKYYEIAPVDNPKGPATGRYRVVRGGSWFDQIDPPFLTCSYRSWTRQDERSPTIGFRCAKSAPGVPSRTTSAGSK